MRRYILLFIAFSILNSQFSIVSAQGVDSLQTIDNEAVTDESEAGNDDRPRFQWGVRFDTKFDNREYKALERVGAANSKTLFSVRLVPVLGIGWAENHSIMAGASFTLDMGGKLNNHPIEPVIYYNYRSKLFGAFAGKFERRHLIGGYTRAIYAGSSAFYDPVVDGFALQYHPERGKLELVLDWDGMQSKTMRESFRVLSAGEGNPFTARAIRWLSAGYSFDMYHLAQTAGGSEGVVDHILVNPWIGADFHKLWSVFEKLTLQIGYLGGFDRVRADDNGWDMEDGMTIDFTIQKWRVGIRNRFYIGEELMPLLGESYGKRIYKGDGLYAASGTYNYLQIYWRPRVARGMNLDLEVGLHTDGEHWGFQQVAGVGVSFDNEFFTRRPRRRGAR